MARSQKSKDWNKALNTLFGNVDQSVEKTKQCSNKNLNSRISNYRNKSHRKIKHSSNRNSNRSKTITNNKTNLSNKYGIIPMSCTLDIRTIGKLEAAKQVLGVHNRDAVVENLISKSLNKLLNTKGKSGRSDYKLYYKVFLMKHEKSAEKHYEQFYQNGHN